MSRQAEVIRRWIDSLPEGALIRSQDLEHLVNRTQASRELIRLAKAGRLMRVARGMSRRVHSTCHHLRLAFDTNDRRV